MKIGEIVEALKANGYKVRISTDGKVAEFLVNKTMIMVNLLANNGRPALLTKIFVNHSVQDTVPMWTKTQLLNAQDDDYSEWLVSMISTHYQGIEGNEGKNPLLLSMTFQDETDLMVTIKDKDTFQTYCDVFLRFLDLYKTIDKAEYA